MLKGFLFLQQTAIRAHKEASAKRIRFKHQRSAKVSDNDVFTSHNTTVKSQKQFEANVQQMWASQMYGVDYFATDHCAKVRMTVKPFSHLRALDLNII